MPRTNLVLATTTSAQDSGLLGSLLPAFRNKTGLVVEVQAVGSGMAFDKARQGQADVLLTHDPLTERELLDQGIITEYKLIMHNDFIIVGPPDDPAGIRGEDKASAALRRIAERNALWVSRGDWSGTHTREMRLWKDAAAKPSNVTETKRGMAETLAIASGKKGYCLTDRATYLAGKQDLALDVMVEKDEPLLNLYHVSMVNPARFPEVNADGARRLIDFFLSGEAQGIIAGFMRDRFPTPLFYADAGKTEEDVAGERLHI